MDSILPIVAVAALALACPLGMLAIGGTAWLVARARGQKKDLSIGCMPGHSEQQQPVSEEDERKLQEEVARLQQEVEALKAQGAGRSQL